MDHFAEFRSDKLLHLRWPLDIGDGSGSPIAAARRLDGAIEQASYRGLLTARAGAEPDETFWSIARARSGAYADSLSKQKALSARAKDILFYPGADEAAAFPWVDDASAFFLADRILRSRAVITRVRDYLIAEFNRQVLDVWAQLNDWGQVSLQLRPHLFGVDDWLEMREQLRDGALDLDDVYAAISAETDSVRAATS